MNTLPFVSIRTNALVRIGKDNFGFNVMFYERMVNMSYLFSLDLIKVAQEEKVITNKDGKEEGKYYVISLSNGQKSFEVTCGEKNYLVKIDLLDKCRVAFDIVDKKLKAVDAISISKSVAKAGDKNE